jgi:hypothetical protein
MGQQLLATKFNETITLNWSLKEWANNSKLFGYEPPVAAAEFAGDTLVDQLTRLMLRHFDGLAQELECSDRYFSPEVEAAKISTWANDLLSDVERLVISSITEDLNDHQLIHVQELAKNCVGAVIAIIEALMSTEENGQTLQLHPELCGLLEDVDVFWGHAGHQCFRVPYSPTRVGHEVTYEEIANVFRTSRVNILRIEHEGCFRKLRFRLLRFRDQFRT